MMFGLFKILGYNFSPRFRDLDDQRFWRATMPGVETGTYGAVEDLARNRVNLNKVITHWPDMLKVAGSLVTNQVRAYDLLRMFGRDGRPTPLGAAFAEYGRIAKTEHLLRVVDPVDDTYRRQMNRQLTVQESRHKLARDVCHGKRGTIHQAYRDGMEDQLGALGLVLNAIVLWTTRYIDAAVAQLQAEGHEIREEDVARISPYLTEHINRFGSLSGWTVLLLMLPGAHGGVLGKPQVGDLRLGASEMERTFPSRSSRSAVTRSSAVESSLMTCA
jgi:TnpA family transposase